MFLFFSLLHLSLDILGANASALSLKRLHHEVALEGLTYEQVNQTKQNFKTKTHELVFSGRVHNFFGLKKLIFLKRDYI